MRVLFATDFSRSADQAAKLVAGLAWPLGTAIRIVSVIESSTEGSEIVPETLFATGPNGHRDFGASVRRISHDLSGTGISVDTVVAVGRAAERIVHEAERFDARLIVVGSRGRGALRAALLGSVSAEIVDRAPCPVLVARGEHVRQILFAEDGTSRSLDAAAILRWPVFANTPVQVVSVADVPMPLEMNEETSVAMRAARAYLDNVRSGRERHMKVARETAERLLADGVPASAAVIEGRVASALVAMAAESRTDLIVVGSRGERGLTRFLSGSVARDVLYRAPCSVLIARQRPTAVEQSYAPAAYASTATSR